MSIGRLLLVSLSVVALAMACTKATVVGGRVKAGSLDDGTYIGVHKSPPNSAEVEVLVEGGRIARVTLLHHGASWIGGKAEDTIPQRIVDEQSTDVDVVTGATNSSKVIMNAVQDALDEAAGEKTAGEDDDQ